MFAEEIDRVFKEKIDLPARTQDVRDFRSVLAYDDEAAPHGRIATLFKSLKKYVVSRSGDVDTSWQGSVLLRDITDVKPLRQENGPNLVTQGSTELVHAAR